MLTGFRYHLQVIDELDRLQAIWIQDVGKFLDCRRLGMHAIGFGIPENEDMDKAGWIFLLLPDLVTQRAVLIGSNVVDKFMDGCEALLQCFGAYLVSAPTAGSRCSIVRGLSSYLLVR